MKLRSRITVLILLDMLLIWISIYTSYLFRFSGHIPWEYFSQCMWYATVSMLFVSVSLNYFKLYKRIWQYASIGEMISIVKAVVIGCVCSFALLYLIQSPRVPFSVFMRVLETTIILIGASRFLWRIVRDKYTKKSDGKRKALIIGAGDCGILIAKELKFNPMSPVYPAGFIDDDPLKQRHQIFGLSVLGMRDNIVEATAKHGIDEIIIAMPSVSRKQVTEIINICKLTKAKLKIIPMINDLIQGKVTVNSIRDVEVADLLGRDAIEVDLQGIAKYVNGKTVLVTGAGGSIGSELCRQIAKYNPSMLLLLGHGENSIYDIEKEMAGLFPGLHIVPVIADVQDRFRIDDVFNHYRPQVVFHAAAHKHVPLMEQNPAEAIKNNVFGTKNVAECADQYGAERFVLISTDKAVNPTSMMGATKRIAEMLIQCLDRTSQTRFVAVRFGNVLGSRGSVVPHFKRQIAAGGPVTVTHPEMVRYFMTIPEAVQLVIQAGALAEGGEIFVLDMGKPVKIVDLARDLIRLSGFEPDTDIEIQFSGMRPGEKLYEELLLNEEAVKKTLHNRIFVGSPLEISPSELDFELKQLEKVVGEEQGAIREMIKGIVPGYRNVG